MSAFSYRNGSLSAEAVPLSTIAEAVGTPLYCYSTRAIVERYRAFVDAFEGLDLELCYSLKANSNLAVVRTLVREGAGADVVSRGELMKALAAGAEAARIVFSGVGKSDAELGFALDAGIHQFNVESAPELDRLDALAIARGGRARVALRVNPEVDARTHDKISTGRREDKFGIGWSQAAGLYRRAAAMAGIDLVGLDVHIGSQLTDLEPFDRAFARVADLVAGLRADGLEVRSLDLGGGLGIDYADGVEPALERYAGIVRDRVGGLGCKLMIEPGRSLVGHAGVLLSRIVVVKESGDRRFVILDSAMNDLMRPALYGAEHRILSVAEPAADAPLAPVDFVGPVCETGDRLAADRPVPPLASGDLVAILDAGAYGAVMASTYNSRPLVPEVLVNGDRFAVVRERQSYQAMLALDRLPDWLAPPAPRAAGWGN